MTRLVRRTALFSAGSAMFLMTTGAFLVTPLSAFASTRPTATFSSSVPTQPARTATNPMPVTLTFSTDVMGLVPSMLNIANGTVSNFSAVSGSVYTFNVTPAAPQGSVSIDLNGDQVKDASGNFNIAAPELQFIYDPSAASTTASSTPPGGGTGGGTASSTAPSITITGGPANGSVVSTSTVTFVFTTDGQSTVTCSFGSDPATYMCGSPQTFTGLVAGMYPFSIFAKNAQNVSTSTVRTFTVDFSAGSTTASTTPTSTTTPTTTTTPPVTQTGGGAGNGGGGGGGGGGGNSGISGSGPATSVTTTIVPPPNFSTSGFTSSTPDFSEHPGLASGVGGRLMSARFRNGNDTDNGTLAIGTQSNLLGAGMNSSNNSSTTTVTSNDVAIANADTAGTPAPTTQAAAAGLLGLSNTTFWFIILLIALLLLGAWYANRRRATT
jgi:hypothetical protein